MFEPDRDHRCIFIRKCVKRLARNLLVRMKQRGSNHRVEIVAVEATRCVKRRDRDLRLGMGDQLSKRTNGSRVEALPKRACDGGEEKRLIGLERTEKSFDPD